MKLIIHSGGSSSGREHEQEKNEGGRTEVNIWSLLQQKILQFRETSDLQINKFRDMWPYPTHSNKSPNSESLEWGIGVWGVRLPRPAKGGVTGGRQEGQGDLEMY